MIRPMLKDNIHATDVSMAEAIVGCTSEGEDGF